LVGLCEGGLGGRKRFTSPFILIPFGFDDAAMKDWVSGLEKDKEELSEKL
jgi:hypothetical protein